MSERYNRPRMTVWEIIEMTMGRMRPPRDQQWLAAECGVSPQAVNQWKTAGVPASRFRQISDLLRIKLDQLEGLEPLPWDKGWPFPDIDQDRFYQLSVKERDQVQGKVLTLIEELELARQRAQSGHVGLSGTHLVGEVKGTPQNNAAPAKKTKKPRKPPQN